MCSPGAPASLSNLASASTCSVITIPPDVISLIGSVTSRPQSYARVLGLIGSADAVGRRRHEPLTLRPCALF
jgi:hypothetical protein